MTDWPDASAMTMWLRAAVVELEWARDQIDSVNVFPVPDHDTGSNMLATLREAVSVLPDGLDDGGMSGRSKDATRPGEAGGGTVASSGGQIYTDDDSAMSGQDEAILPAVGGRVENLVGEKMGGGAVAATGTPTSAAAVVASVARQALLAAQGNSGILLTEWLGGFAAGLAECQAEPDDRDAGVHKSAQGECSLAPDGSADQDSSFLPTLWRALDEAQRAAYESVFQPVEGTFLTVAQRAAAPELRQMPATDWPGRWLRIVAGALDESIGPDGPDAGALGLAVILDALANCCFVLPPCAANPLNQRLRDFVEEMPQSASDHVDDEAAGTVPPMFCDDSTDSGKAFEVMGVVRPATADAEGTLIRELGAYLTTRGDSLIIGRTGGAIHFHVHTDDPDALIDGAKAFGRIDPVVSPIRRSPTAPSAAVGPTLICPRVPSRVEKEA